MYYTKLLFSIKNAINIFVKSIKQKKPISINSNKKYCLQGAYLKISW